MPRAAHLAVGAIAGALALRVGAGSVALVGVAIVLLELAHRTRRGRAAGDPRLPGLGLVPVGVGLLLISARGMLAADAPPSTEPPDGRGPWVAVVESVGAPRAGSRPAIVRLEAPQTPRVAATLPWFPSVGLSDRIALSGSIRAPPEGPYGEYLVRIGVVGTLRADALELLPPEDGPARRLEELRRSAAAAIALAVPEPEAGLAAGVLIGLRDRVDSTLAADFTTAGASHVVAISGWNIAIVASTLAAVAGSLDRRRRAILTAIAIAAYVAFVGPSASVVRAAAMAGVALLARELGRPGSAAAALGWAVTLLLLSDPAWVGDAGFRLSALATAGIIAWGSSWSRRLEGATPNRTRRWLAEVLGVSLAAQVATLPIVLLDFGRLSLVAPVVNLLVVPLVPPAMAAGALALGGGVAVLAGLPAIVATLVGLPAWALYGLIVAGVRIGAAAPFASVELTEPWDTIAAAAAAALILAATRVNAWQVGLGREHAFRGRPARAPAHPARPGPSPARTATTARSTSAAHSTSATRSSRFGGASRLAAAGLVVAIAGLGLAVAHRPDGAARIVVLDVGQGDAILVEGGQGGRLLVDGGPEPERLLIALDERLPPWDHRIDAIVLSHPHEDHVAGLALLLERYRVDRVYETGMAGPGPGYAAWETALDEPGAPPRKTLAAGDRLAVDEIRLRVLWPDPGTVAVEPAATGKGINNVSIVLLGDVHGQRFLLTGDIEEEVDPDLVARGLPRVDVLKVAHHGSRTASTMPLLQALEPRIAVISVGRDNGYGHPAPETLERLQAVAGRTYRTDLDGTVEIVLDGVTARATVHADSRVTAIRAATSPIVEPAVDGRLGRLRYHRPDGGPIELGDRVRARFEFRGARLARPARLLLGRRRVWSGRGGRRLPERTGALPRGSAGALAAAIRSRRPRPPPGRGSRAAGHALDVRGGLARRDRRDRGAAAPQPGS